MIPKTLKGWITLGVAVAVIALVVFLFIRLSVAQSKLDKAQAEIQTQAYNQEKVRIETEYIPAQLGKLTTNEKSHMGSVLWGE